MTYVQGTIINTNSDYMSSYFTPSRFKHAYVDVYIRWRAISQLKCYTISTNGLKNIHKSDHYYSLFKSSMLQVSDFQESLIKCSTNTWAVFLLKLCGDKNCNSVKSKVKHTRL